MYRFFFLLFVTKLWDPKITQNPCLQAWRVPQDVWVNLHPVGCRAVSQSLRVFVRNVFAAWCIPTNITTYCHNGSYSSKWLVLLIPYQVPGNIFAAICHIHSRTAPRDALPWSSMTRRGKWCGNRVACPWSSLDIVGPHRYVDTASARNFPLLSY